MNEENAKDELKAIEELRKQMQDDGLLNCDGEYYLADGECISVELCYDLGIWR